MSEPLLTIDRCLDMLTVLANIFAEAQKADGVKFTKREAALVKQGLDGMIVLLDAMKWSQPPKRPIANMIDEIESNLESLRQQEASGQPRASANVIHFSEASRIAKRFRDADALDRRPQS